MPPAPAPPPPTSPRTVPLLTPYLAGAELVTLTLGANDLDIKGLVMACSTLGTDAACDVALRREP